MLYLTDDATGFQFLIGKLRILGEIKTVLNSTEFQFLIGKLRIAASDPATILDVSFNSL